MDDYLIHVRPRQLQSTMDKCVDLVALKTQFRHALSILDGWHTLVRTLRCHQLMVALVFLTQSDIGVSVKKKLPVDLQPFDLSRGKSPPWPLLNPQSKCPVTIKQSRRSHLRYHRNMRKRIRRYLYCHSRVCNEEAERRQDQAEEDDTRTSNPSRIIEWSTPTCIQ